MHILTRLITDRSWDSCELSDRHAQCNDEVPIRCQQRLHTQEYKVSEQVKIQRIQICRGTARLKCAGAPILMWHIRAVTASTTSFSSSEGLATG
jgi:hypothetical protein